MEQHTARENLKPSSMSILLKQEGAQLLLICFPEVIWKKTRAPRIFN